MVIFDLKLLLGGDLSGRLIYSLALNGSLSNILKENKISLIIKSIESIINFNGCNLDAEE